MANNKLAKAILSLICKKRTKRATHRVFIRPPLSLDIRPPMTEMQTPKAKTMIKQRAALAEHPFGTIKQKLGWSHFLVRGKTKVIGENALTMLTYNFRRLLNLIGITLFQKLIKANKSGNLESIKQEITEYLAVLDFFRAFFLQKMNLRV